MTDVERAAALESIAEEIRACTRCRLHQTRTLAVPGEGDPATEVVFVGEGPGFNEDRQGRPFVGRAGALLERLLASIGWRRQDVFITNIVKCRPPDNRDPEADEIAACSSYLRRQLEALDPAIVVTLGRHSMARFMPGARISQAHGTARPADPATGARQAVVFAMYHPAAALRTQEIERQSYEDVAAVPATLLAARALRDRERETLPASAAAAQAIDAAAPTPDLAAPAPDASAPTPDAADRAAPTVAVDGGSALASAPNVADTTAGPVPSPEPVALPVPAAFPTDSSADGGPADQLTLF